MFPKNRFALDYNFSAFIAELIKFYSTFRRFYLLYRFVTRLFFGEHTIQVISLKTFGYFGKKKLLDIMLSREMPSLIINYWQSFYCNTTILLFFYRYRRTDNNCIYHGNEYNIMSIRLLGDNCGVQPAALSRIINYIFFICLYII